MKGCTISSFLSLFTLAEARYQDLHGSRLVSVLRPFILALLMLFQKRVVRKLSSLLADE